MSQSVCDVSAGRSMGCRAAAAVARQLGDDAVQGVICLSFPLHPPAQKHVHQQRSADLRGLPACMPVLFVSGTEDNMCDRVRAVTDLDFHFVFKLEHMCQVTFYFPSFSSDVLYAAKPPLCFSSFLLIIVIIISTFVVVVVIVIILLTLCGQKL